MPPQIHYVCEYSDERAPSGQPGVNGLDGPPGRVGIDGSEGRQRVGTLEWSELASQIPMPQLQLLLRDAGLAYLNGKLDVAHARLTWIVTITAVTEALDAEARTLGLQARALLAQMGAGLDYYGHPKDWTPLVAHRRYEELVDKLLLIAKSIESARQEYQKEALELNDKLSYFDVVMASVTEARRALQQEIKDGEDQRGRLAKVAAELSDAQQTLARELDDTSPAGVAFKRAVENKARQESGGDCDFGQILGTVASIASVAGVAWKSATSIISQFKQLQQGAGAGLAGVGQVLGVVQTVQCDVKAIGQAFQTLSTTLAGQPADAGKLMVVREDFEETIKPFLDLPEARAYRGLVRQYLDVIAARNQHLIDMNAHDLRITGWKRDLARQEAEALRLSDERVRLDEGAIERGSFIQRAADEVKAHLVQILYLEHKALDYWSLKHNEFTLNGYDLSRLGELHGNLLREVESANNNRTRKHQEFRIEPPIVYSVDNAPEIIASLRRSGRVEFRLPLDHEAFRRIAEVVVHRIVVHVHGAKTSDGELHVKLMHHGDPVFRSTSGTVVRFSHKPRYTFLQYDIATLEESALGDLGGLENSYAYLSPFATWTLYIPPESNRDLDTSDVSGVTLGFHGFGLASPL